MMAETTIEWTDATWNPVAGCSIMSAGCTNCYAMRMAARLEAMGVEKYRGLTRKSGGRPKWTGALYLDENALQIPKTWSRPRNVFVNSMSDLFHPDVPVHFVQKVKEPMPDDAPGLGAALPREQPPSPAKKARKVAAPVAEDDEDEIDPDNDNDADAENDVDSDADDDFPDHDEDD